MTHQCTSGCNKDFDCPACPHGEVEECGVCDGDVKNDEKSLVNEIIRTIDAGEWVYNRFYWTHKSGLMIWNANGVLFCETYPEKSGLTIFEKIKIWSAFKHIGRKRAIKYLTP